MWIGKDAGISDYAERFIGEEAADAETLIPGTEVFAVGAAAVGGYHSSYSTVHENAGAAAAFFDSVVKGADEVGGENALVRADYLGVTGVIDQSNERFAIGIEGLNYIASRVVEPLGVIIVGDFSSGVTSCDSYSCWLELADCLVNRIGQFCAYLIYVLKIES